MSAPAEALAAGIHDLAAARGGIYGLLARLLAAPATPEDRARLADRAFVAEIAGVFEEGVMEAWARRLGSADLDIERRERQDFMDLLATPSRKFVRPWESVYRDARQVGERRVPGLLCGPSTVAVEQDYRAAGYSYRPKGLIDLADHAALEMGFLEALCGREREAAEAGRPGEAELALGRERRFLAEHVLLWIPRLAGELAERAETDLYRGLGALLARFAEAEATLLALDARGPDRAPARSPAVAGG